MRLIFLALLGAYTAFSTSQACAATSLLGTSCTEKELGTTRMDATGDNIIACLYETNPGNAVWKIVTIGILTKGTTSCGSGKFLSGIASDGSAVCSAMPIQDVSCSSGRVVSISSSGVPTCGAW
ncbi:MAG: hypothetical protein WC464_08670 [Bdellovibrionales bacterium]